MSRVLSARNLLRPRSNLLYLGSASIDTTPYERIEAADVKELPMNRGTLDGGAAVRSDFADRMAKNLVALEEENYALGREYFREGDFMRAQRRFEICRTLDRRKTRYVVAQVFVSQERGEYNRAAVLLRTAFQSFDTLDDLRIAVTGDDHTDARGFYPEREMFERVVDAVNIRANLRQGSAEAQLLLAYYAWLNDEHSTAIAAAKAAERLLGAASFASGGGEERAQAVVRFQEALIDEPR